MASHSLPLLGSLEPVHLVAFLQRLSRSAEAHNLSWDEAWVDASLVVSLFGQLDQRQQLQVIGDLVQLLNEPCPSDVDLSLWLMQHTSLPMGLLEERVPVRTSLEELRDLLVTAPGIDAKLLRLAFDRLDPDANERS